ncbi:hypothetical protein [Niallia sp. FSL R7-0271]|uniref:hypothetical protein n=1 Tax=Niallia sp. FSL R7-0271 TaxID=2921678 RepID=UPI0030F92492
MMSNYPYDIINGEEVPPLVINENYTLTGKHSGTVQVESGEFQLLGSLSGSLHVHSGATAYIKGKQSGSVSVDSGGKIIVIGNLSGSMMISNNSVLIVEPNGKAFGSLLNNGTLILRGVLAGARSGQGELIIEGAGYIKTPVIRNGIHYYQ